MNKITNKNSRFKRPTKRLGVSLIEVIACTALVAIMIVPIAGIIRASGQAVAQSDLDSSTEAKMRRGLAWLSDSIRDGQLLGVGTNEMKLTLKSGLDVKFTIDDDNLVMTDGRDSVVVSEGVREIQFAEIKQSVSPNPTIGIEIKLSAIDPVTRNVVSISSMTSIPTQD